MLSIWTGLKFCRLAELNDQCSSNKTEHVFLSIIHVALILGKMPLENIEGKGENADN